MDAFSLILSDMRSQYAYEESEKRRRSRATDRLLSDPSKIDTLAANITARISPSARKPKLSKFASKTEAYDSVIPEDHPFKGMGMQIRDKLLSILSDPSVRGVDPSRIVSTLTQTLMNRPGKFGISKAEEAMEYKRREDARWWGGKDIRPLPGYEEWVAKRRIEEDPLEQLKMYREAISKETDPVKKKELQEQYKIMEEEASPIPSAEEILSWAGLTLGTGAVASLETGGLSIPASVALTAAGIASALFGKPFLKEIQDTEWYRSIAGPLTRSRGKTSLLESGAVASLSALAGWSKGSKFSVPVGIVAAGVGGTLGALSMTDTGKALVASLAPYAASDAVFSKAFVGTFVVPKAVAESVVANPSASNVIEAGRVYKSSKEILQSKDAVAEFATRLFNPRANETFGINQDVYEAFRQITNKFRSRVQLSKYYTRAATQAYKDFGPEMFLNSSMIDTPENFRKLSRRGFEVVSKDPEAFQRAMSHPDGFVRGAIKEAEEQKLIEYIPGQVEQELDHAAAIETVKQKASQKIADRVIQRSVMEHEAEMVEAKEAGIKTGMSKQYYEGEDITAGYDWAAMAREEERLAPGNPPPVVMVNQAKATDAVAEQAGVSSKEVYDQISKAIKSYEAPSIKKIMQTATKPVSRIEEPTVLDSPATAVAEAENIIKAQKKAKTVETLAKKTVKTKVSKAKGKAAVVQPTEIKVPEPEEILVARVNEKGEKIFNKQGVMVKDKRYQIKTPEGKNIYNLKDDSNHFKTARQAKAEYKKFMEQATPEEAALPPKFTKADIGTVTRTGKSFTEIVDTELGPMQLEYAPTKTVGKEEARQVALDNLNKLVGQQVKEIEYETQIKALEDMTRQELDATLIEHKKLYDAGEIGAEEMLDVMKKASVAAVNSWEKKFATEEGLGDWLGVTDPFVKQLQKIVGSKMFMALFGVPAVVYSVFGPDEADAGMVDKFATAAVKGLAKAKNLPKASEMVLKAFQGARYMVEHDIPADKFLLKEAEYQVGIPSTAVGGASKIAEDITKWYANTPKGRLKFRHWLMSPHMILDEVTTTGKWLMNNPGVFKASWQTAEYVNNINANKIIDNIVNAAGIKSARKEVIAAFKPLVPLMEKQVEYEFRTDTIKSLLKENENLLAGKRKKITPDMREAIITDNKRIISEYSKRVKDLEGTTEEFHKSWEEIAAPLAREHSAVRTFLAIGDDTEFSKYPFLKGIPFSREEKLAVGRAKQQLLVYKKRIEGLGKDVIEENYSPHIFHPNFKARELEGKTGTPPDKIASYLKIYKRSFNSRPLVPDFETSLRTYVGDIERRIHQIGFWEKNGWNTIMERTKHIPVINHAFKLLKEGMTPPEATTLNKFSQRYVEFEAVHKLFLSPSAGTKHLIKAVADLAQLGPSETVHAIPSAIKSTVLRVAEANPKVAKTLTDLGIKSKSAQSKLITNYSKSLIPAYGVRRYALDLGIAPLDEMFTAMRGVWGKVQDVSGALINGAEMIDRGLTISLGEQVAAKEGLTIEQAMYGTYDMLLKNNFLSREFNPGWLNTPWIRAMAMFQATPFKLFERRMVNFVRSGRVVKDLGKKVYELTKADLKDGTFTRSREVLRHLRNLRADVKRGEHALKTNLFLKTAMQEQDFLGINIVNQFARDVFIIAAASYGGYRAGLNLKHHFFHVPFLKPGTVLPTLSFNPAISGIFTGIDAWQRREDGDDEFLTTKIYQRWLGKGWAGVLPTPMQKIIRVTENDIPAIYKESPYRYLLAVPSVKEK